MAAGWAWASRTTEIWWTRRGGPAAVAAASRSRFAALAAHARGRSPFYRDAYRGLPDRPLAPADVPVVTRRALMARFDDWVTSSEITRRGIEAFLADRARIGERYLDRYVVWKSSGTTGEPGIYVQDADALTTFDALMTVHADPLRFATRHAWPVFPGDGRAALVVATGDHFASIASWRRLCRGNPWMTARGFSILEPLPALVAELNAWQPAFLASYPTMLSLLAEERATGRLRISPACLWSGGECLSPGMRARIEKAFGTRVDDEYGASECMSIAFGCSAGWLHVNADWVVLEAVDDAYRPTPPGEPSRTALLTNLANRVQPIIRYDLGDSILVKPDPCPCGSVLPAIRVEGRHDDIVALAGPDGRVVRLLPLALATVVEEAVPGRRFQIVQSAASRLLLRLEPEGGHGHAASWPSAAAALRRYLARQSLPNVEVMPDRHAPLPDPVTGKLREVIVAAGAAGRPRHPGHRHDPAPRGRSESTARAPAHIGDEE